MKPVVYTDKNGFLRRVLIKDDDGLEMAEFGLPAGPPDINMIDWEVIKKLVNNAFVENEIYTLADLQKKRGLETVANIVKRHVQELFREKAKAKKERRNL
jgi:predicted nuclease with TOPRIM domain